MWPDLLKQSTGVSSTICLIEILLLLSALEGISYEIKPYRNREVLSIQPSHIFRVVALAQGEDAKS